MYCIDTRLHQVQCQSLFERMHPKILFELILNIYVQQLKIFEKESFLSMYIPEYKPRILGGFYKAKVGGSAYIRVYAPQKKITS